MASEKVKSAHKAIDLENVSKMFVKFQALDDGVVDICDNEFFTMLGPSGRGKTKPHLLLPVQCHNLG
jgi:ABC-type proline/glycine betaine transport system ATPase subunit